MSLKAVACTFAILAAAIAASHQAAAETWSGAYGATIMSTYTDGRTAKVYVEPDHTYSVVLPNGTILKGTWADSDGQSCFTLDESAPGAKPTCFPAKEYKVGDSFNGEDSSGKFTGVIQAGR
jgi:hypothetical protein